MKTPSGFLLMLLIVAFQTLFLGSPLAQNTITSTVNRQAGNQSTGYGRDFWFAIPQNYQSAAAAGKYFNIYVGSLQNTTVNVQVPDQPLIQRSVIAGEVTILTSPADIPLDKELTSSGVVETNKAIHVWSDDADLSVYFLSRAPFTTDGMYVIPTMGWGRRYVIASYASLSVDPKISDDPSEFALVADQDSTVVTITPSHDIRMNGADTVVLHQKGVPFNEILQKGECIQYQITAIADTGSDISDITGTVVTSNHSIGAIGASVCPFIPTSDPYCDYILDMLPPLRTWSGKYYSAPFAGRKFGGDAFLVVASADSQQVMRNGQVAAVLNANDHFFLNDVTEASEWTSDAPFMLTQYICSSTHGSTTPSIRNQGDPAMVVINSADQFGKDVLFQTPKIDLASGQSAFTNYVNVIIPSDHEAQTTYDGVAVTGNIPNIKKIERIPIPNTTMEAIRLTYLPNQGEGTHIVSSDTGVGVYIYGYGTDDSYAWAGNLGVITPNIPDTSAPFALGNGLPSAHRITVNDDLPGASKLNEIAIDALENMHVTIDRSFVPGEGIGNSYYDLSVIDNAKPARALVSVYDMAGNRTRIESKYSVASSVKTGTDMLSNDLEANGIGILPVIPNPVNAADQTSLRFIYGMRSPGLLDLSIYDILGNVVATVVHDDHHLEGIYESDFPMGRNMPSGSYIYRLSGAGKVISGKLVIAR